MKQCAEYLKEEAREERQRELKQREQISRWSEGKEATRVETKGADFKME